jgi:gliding motility-associated-like protein
MYASGADAYSWLPGAGLSATTGNTVNASPSVSVTYTVTGTTLQGCSNVTTSTVTIIPLPLLSVAANSTLICVGNTTTLSASGSSAGSYTWSASPFVSPIASTVPSVAVSPTLTTVYAVTCSNGISPYACSATKTITIIVGSDINLITAYADPVCQGYEAVLSAKGGNIYQWQPATGLEHPQDSTTKASPSVTTIYTVTASKNGSCIKTATVEVIVNPVPYVYAGADTTINIDEYTILLGTGDVEVGFLPATNMPLNCNFCDQLTVNPQENTCYILLGTNAYGCSATDTVCVTVTKAWDVYIPNAFTPNGDSYNEIFIPVGYGLSKISLTIFYRWGELIFKSNDDKTGWDGYCKGKPCKQDIYVYQAEILTMEGSTITRTGHITLLPRLK